MFHYLAVQFDILLFLCCIRLHPVLLEDGDLERSRRPCKGAWNTEWLGVFAINLHPVLNGNFMARWKFQPTDADKQRVLWVGNTTAMVLQFLSGCLWWYWPLTQQTGSQEKST
ncbi:uncharacterized protein LOC111869345 isoform X2 [Cryptotermes secundus]|uniref:uncharacterized protein LOC111869345 isoform X2 n=1 Tax=Cryptotermes secundus TaxID=105785 RepID=UPI001454C50E|nr:uncharacterized protein LOC111869345 isoform X2 [Cryptotermes secundus]